MFLFIAIIFIAELIIASTLVIYIVKADRFVCSLSAKVSDAKEKVLPMLLAVHTAIQGLNDKIQDSIHYLKKRKTDYQINLAKNILLYALLFVLKGRYKRAASICNLFVLAKDWYDRNIA